MCHFVRYYGLCTRTHSRAKTTHVKKTHQSISQQHHAPSIVKEHPIIVRLSKKLNLKLGITYTSLCLIPYDHVTNLETNRFTYFHNQINLHMLSNYLSHITKSQVIKSIIITYCMALDINFMNYNKNISKLQSILIEQLCSTQIIMNNQSPNIKTYLIASIC